MASPTPAGKWYVESNMGLIPVSDTYNQRVEDSLRCNHATIRLSFGSFSYQIDLSGYPTHPPTQRNLSTNKIRFLKRFPVTSHKWEFEAYRGTFQPYENTEFLESEYRNDPTTEMVMISPLGYTLLLDFRRMKQTNLETGKVRNIRRVVPSGAALAVDTAVASPQSIPTAIQIWRPLKSTETAPPDSCAICLNDMKPSSEEIVELLGCKNHCYHRLCIQPLLQSEGSLKCPICTRISGNPQTGNQPSDGTMTVATRNGSIHGIRGSSFIVIQYSFPDGIQDRTHPSPNRKYHGTKRTAYLPNTTEGRDILKLLKVAWERRLIFTVGTSITTGRSDCVIWAGIHHKTSTSGGTYGYPDESYFKRVKEELRDRGVA